MLTAPAECGSQIHDGLNDSNVRPVAVADLQVGYSPCQSKLDNDHVASLMEMVDHLPPVIVNERTMTVLDGVHRLEAFRVSAAATLTRSCSRVTTWAHWS